MTPRARAHHFYLLPLLAVASLLGCGDPQEQIIYKDHPVEFDEEAQDDLIVGDPELILGVFEEQLFRELEAGEEVEIVRGFQGGTWVHISLRATGVNSNGFLEARLGDLGDVSYSLNLTRSPEGYLEAYDVPVPVETDDPGSVDGVEVELEVTFRSEAADIEASLPLVLVSP